MSPTCPQAVANPVIIPLSCGNRLIARNERYD